MSKFMDWLDKVLTPVADVLSNNKFLKSMSNGLIATMPLTMIAGIFYMIVQVPEAFGYVWNESLRANLLTPYNVLFGVLALVVSFTVAYEHAKNYDALKPLNSGLVSMVSFVIVAAPYSGGSFDGSYLGYGGIFCAILTAIISVEIFNFCVHHKLAIKMPDSVPPLVANSFEAIVPLFAVLGGLHLANCLVIAGTEKTIPAWIASVVSPTLNGADSWVYQSLYHLLMQLFFWLGMHGWAVTASFALPVSISMQAEQAAAYAAGESLPYVSVGAYSYANLVWVLPLLLVVVCKAERNKAIGKLSLIPAIFGISEPSTFGVPVVMNPILGIPFILYQPILVIWCYFTVASGILPRTVSSISVIPAPISQWMVMGTWKVFPCFLVGLALAVIVWYPFIKVWDNKCLREEEELKAAKAAAEIEK